MTMTSCPHCGGALRLVAAGPDRQPAPSLAWKAEDDGIVRGRPRKLYRGEGRARASAWGAVTSAPVELRAVVRVSAAKSGRTWMAKVAAIVEPAGAGSVVELAGAKWKPDPEDRDDDSPDDPAWLTDTSGDTSGDLFRPPAEPAACGGADDDGHQRGGDL